MPLPSNGMTTGLTCNESYAMVQSSINNMNYTKLNSVPSSYRISHVRDVDPVGALRPSISTSHETQREVAVFLRIKADASGSNGMINNLFNPASLGFIYDSSLKEWRLYRQWDRLTLTNTVPPLTNWTLERKEFLRTDSQTDYNNGTWETVNTG
jgi:hypothetical protein